MEDEKLPAPAELPDKKPSKDATQEESLKELAEKLHSLGNNTKQWCAIEFLHLLHRPY